MVRSTRAFSLSLSSSARMALSRGLSVLPSMKASDRLDSISSTRARWRSTSTGRRASAMNSMVLEAGSSSGEGLGLAGMEHVFARQGGYASDYRPAAVRRGAGTAHPGLAGPGFTLTCVPARKPGESDLNEQPALRREGPACDERKYGGPRPAMGR